VSDDCEWAAGVLRMVISFGAVGLMLGLGIISILRDWRR